MRFLLYDDDGVLLRKFWSRDAAEVFLQEGYKIVEMKREKRVKVSKASHLQLLIAEVGEAPF
jgi:hypothetical protein